jgi:hypothetical protein
MTLPKKRQLILHQNQRTNNCVRSVVLLLVRDIWCVVVLFAPSDRGRLDMMRTACTYRVGLLPYESENCIGSDRTVNKNQRAMTLLVHRSRRRLSEFRSRAADTSAGHSQPVSRCDKPYYGGRDDVRQQEPALQETQQKISPNRQDWQKHTCVAQTISYPPSLK